VETIIAIPRLYFGTSFFSKERKARCVPNILFEKDSQHSGNKRLVFVQTNQICKLVNHLGLSFFLSRGFELEIKSLAFESDNIVDKVRVLPCLVCVVFLPERNYGEVREKEGEMRYRGV
jgi:large subunit ribosomal protein L25